MKPEDFDLLAGIVKQRSGLVLTPEKVYLLESRLMPIARKRGLSELEELVSVVRAASDENLLTEITDAMTTNESYFFRDSVPFELFENHTLPLLLEARAHKKALRIWCAAASTGQEPYSLAMVLKENATKFEDWRIEIVATDISSEVLEKAKAGLYSQFEVQRGLPIQMLVKNFTQVGEMWQIDSSLKAMVDFRHFNLLDDPTTLGKFDLVFCRNVLIYFDSETKSQVLNGIAKTLPPDGAIYLGAAETVIGITDHFRPVKGKRGIYELNGVPVA
jgi:chemotaxis protein methyltransferase CheR